ncbi:uncharacterized protein LOC142984513 [Anticarsia gemmatalis]|uniref:uncharacterized protein LOC142984513 n=1 Tax=Anticarsia gemmatalis TaxID=129554 RepID=UPI003F75C846
MAIRGRYLFILLLVSCSGADYSDFTVSDSIFLKTLRELTDQTKADTLNLPANASSIRENITDTFSCENRTYGYYADVDNDCQVFHVCNPMQLSGGKNVTYRYSFICPNETIFNQEVLTCTRPKDSIPCEESPNFYHLNMEIGKEPNKTESDSKKERKTQKRKEIKRKENIVMENLIKDIVKDELKEKLETLEFGVKEVEKEVGDSPMLIEAVIENIEESSHEQKETEEDLDRIVMERNMRNERQMRRGGFRFKSDV